LVVGVNLFQDKTLIHTDPNSQSAVQLSAFIVMIRRDGTQIALVGVDPHGSEFMKRCAVIRAHHHDPQGWNTDSAGGR